MKIYPHITNYRTINKFKLLKEEFYKTHKDFYDYSKVVYKSSRDKVIVICPVHGEFTKTPDSHKRGSGCSKCSILRKVNSDIYIDDDFLLYRTQCVE